jgi:hypothetical protein
MINRLLIFYYFIEKESLQKYFISKILILPSNTAKKTNIKYKN